MNRFRDDGPPSKKFRNDFPGRGGRGDNRRPGGRDDRFGAGSVPKSFTEKNPDIERHNAPPSRVLHVRGLRDYATENDIVDAVKQFGHVTYVMMIPRNRQALVEFETVEDAKGVVEFASNNVIYVCGQPAFFNFSTSDSIKRPEGMMNSDGTPPDNKILLFNILNPKYPITVDVMNTICSPHGEVVRVVINKKQGVQALVEFEGIESARKAKQALNGCDVYSGCCTLKIEFARPDITRLNVVKNDKETFDFTNPNPGAGISGRSALLGDGPSGGGGSRGFGNGGGWDDGGNRDSNSYTEPAFFNEPNQGFRRGSGNFNGPSFGNGPGSDMGDSGFNDGFRQGGRGGMGGGRGRGGMGRGFGSGRGGFQGRGGVSMGGPGHMGMGGMGGPGDGGPQPGSVLLVYGLANGKFNCDKLFNIFCIYGNVIRVKMLRSKEGGAMVNMQDHASCERAIMNLNNSYFFNSKLSVSFSRQEFVNIHPNPSELDDGTPSAKDYSNSKNNRFFNPDSINKTRFSPPTKVIHFFNAPPSSKDDDLKRVFIDAQTIEPVRVRIFPVKPSARSAAGLIEFEGVPEASEALVAANHTIIPNPDGRLPFSLKLSFSASPIIDKPGREEHQHQQDASE